MYIQINTRIIIFTLRLLIQVFIICSVSILKGIISNYDEQPENKKVFIGSRLLSARMTR